MAGDGGLGVSRRAVVLLGCVVLLPLAADAQGRGTAAQALGTWSLHHATRTVGQPQNYWWGFPSWATLDAGGFLRVHWYQVSPTKAQVA